MMQLFVSSAVGHRRVQPFDCHSQPGCARSETEASGRKVCGGIWREQITAEGQRADGEQEEAHRQRQHQSESALNVCLFDDVLNLFCFHLQIKKDENRKTSTSATSSKEISALRDASPQATKSKRLLKIKII